jgi:prolyl-tRNA synthetase
MGALIMAHSDDNGLIVPPRLAPIQAVIVPIYKNEEQLKTISAKVDEIVKALRSKGISVKYDTRDSLTPGFKFADWEMHGVPVRLALGERDLQNGTIEVSRRDKERGEEGAKTVAQIDGIENTVAALLEEIQTNLYNKALNFRTANTRSVDSYDDFKEMMAQKGGFALAHWDGTTETELKIKEETKATIRCIPLDSTLEEGKCIYSGKPSKQRVLFAVAY